MFLKLIISSLLITAFLTLVIKGKICTKHIEYRVLGQVVENVGESNVNCTENYCTHVTIDIPNIFTGFEWGCRNDMETTLGNLLIISPGMKNEVNKMKDSCNKLTSYSKTGDIQNTNYKIYVNCFKNSIGKTTITNYISLIPFFTSFIIIKFLF